MPTTLKWDQIEERVYERGIDRVALYLDDGTAVSWSGVVSITENQNVNASPTYFDGNKVNSITETDSYSASLSAITYPDEVTILEGSERINHGIYLTNQYPQPFSMSYRTGVGDALNGTLSNHKIHIVFGLMLLPQDRERSTINADPEIDIFEWQLSSIPPEVGNYRPTAHIVLDEASMPELLRDELYLALYGDGVNPPAFTSVEDLIDQILQYSFWQIDDNGDKTFSATPFDPDDLVEVDPGADPEDDDYKLYEMHNVEIEWIDDDTYLLLNGYGVSTSCNPRVIGGYDQPSGDGDCWHLVRSALASDELSHYIGTAPLNSQETQPVWRVTKIIFGPPVTMVVTKNVRWTERES